MYRVVLIDDENIIVEGLRRVVKWADYGCEVVGTANDAAEGAEKIRTLHPDILFTDIRMPGQDGLVMLAGLRSEFPDMQVTVMTGYRDFAYAQEAIRLGVTRFLLKPTKMDEIKEALQTMVARLDKLSPAPDTPPEEDTEPHAQSAGSFLVEKAIEYMKEHYQEKLTLQLCVPVASFQAAEPLRRKELLRYLKRHPHPESQRAAGRPQPAHRRDR